MTKRHAKDAPAMTTPGRAALVGLAMIALAGMAVSPLLGTATAHAGTDTFTIEARESGCSGSQYCYVATEGDPANISAGDQVKIFFENPSSNNAEHNLHVTLPGDADSAHEDTPASAAFAQTETIAPGETAEIQFQVPSGSPGLYWWCEVQGHEQLGMWESLSFNGAGGGDGETQNGSPFPTLGALVGLAAVALLVRRR